MRLKTVILCEKCGFQSSKWIGKCPQCDAWNSFYEDVIEKGPSSKQAGAILTTTPLLHEAKPETRIDTSIAELNRVLGGGIVKGSVILLSGEPGIGKSTMTLQLCDQTAKNGSTVMYVSGEESRNQIAMRAKRLNIQNNQIQFLAETNFENILATLEAVKPDCVVLDSIQVIFSTQLPSLAGSINQVRFCTESLMNYAKKNAIPVILIGHVTKDGTLAGPRSLEHLVDTVLFLEGERYQNLRILRSLKNRFGPTHEVGIFEMTELGLQEVANPSEIFLEGRKKDANGSAITATMKGTRPLLIEVQALTNISAFGYPKRAASGFDLNRMQLLVAVIQKHLQLNLSNQDVYVNIVGGFRLDEPAADLAVAMAIISSHQKNPLPSDAVYIGEIGLSGELRTITDISRRIQESAKMGFKKIFVPKTSTKNLPPKSACGSEIFMVTDLPDIMKYQKA